MSTNTELPNNKGRIKRLLFWGVGVICLLIFSASLIAAGLQNGGGFSQSLQIFADSTGVRVFRWGIYIVIWFQWQKLLSYLVQRNVTPDELRRTRRPLLVIVIFYEVFFSFNLLGRIIGG